MVARCSLRCRARWYWNFQSRYGTFALFRRLPCMTHERPGDVRPPAKTPLEGQTYLAFEADFPAERARIGDDADLEIPAGREVATYLLGALDPSRGASRISSEEGVGWSFNSRMGRITVNVLVQYV